MPLKILANSIRKHALKIIILLLIIASSWIFYQQYSFQKQLLQYDKVIHSINDHAASKLIQLDDLRDDELLRPFDKNIYLLQVALTRFQNTYRKATIDGFIDEAIIPDLLADIADIRTHYQNLESDMNKLFEGNERSSTALSKTKQQILALINKPELQNYMCATCIFETPSTPAK